MADAYVARPLEVIGASMPWFREQLAARGINVTPQSALGRALVDLGTFRDKALRGEPFEFETDAETYAFTAASQGADFLTKAIHWGATCGFVLPLKHWKYFAQMVDPIVTRVGRSENARNETWETIIASLTGTFATKVQMEEPDVTCIFGGTRIGIAAKVVYSERKLFERIQQGLKQADRVRADVNVVFVDVVALYPPPIVDGEDGHVTHLRFMRRRAYQTAEETLAVNRAAIDRWCNLFPLDKWREDLKRETRNPFGVIFMTPLLIWTPCGVPAYMFPSDLPLTWEGTTGIDYRYAHAFLNACNHVLGFDARKGRVHEAG